LVQDVHREDPNHHVFDVGHLRDLMNHHAPVNLHGCVENLVQMGDAHQNELDAPLALNY
jgi:hypothetical protein